MERAAHHYGAGDSDEETWAVAGILHDADYERWPEEHPQRTVAWLREQGVRTGSVRFDVIAVERSADGCWTLRHLPGAFDASHSR